MTGSDPLFAESREMATSLKEVDWSRTPLGPVSEWPQSLRTAVSICLSSQFPMVLWWGPELVQIYNHAYRPILGQKHPRSLGQRGQECWAEIWNMIGPMFKGVMERGESTWALDQMLPLSRFGYTEECYFTFSYSPIRSEGGGYGGIFCAVTETTDRVLSERRLRTLSALGSAGVTVEEEVTRMVSAALDANRNDHPFALLYEIDPTDGEAILLANIGIEAGTSMAPRSLAGGDTDPWPVIAASSKNQPLRVGDLAGRGLSGGPWPENSREAWIFPIPGPGAGSAASYMVFGVSPRRAWDDAYRAYAELVCRAIGTVFANARAYSEEKRRGQALAELDRAKTTFFSNVSHEFRTPLTLMLGPLDEILDPTVELPAGIRKIVESVRRNGGRLLRLVNTLLDFTRIQAGRAQASYRPTDLAALTTDLVSAFRAATDRAGLTLTVDCAPSLDQVYVDRDMWEKIILNLMSNAFKFTFTGGISVVLYQENECVLLLVRDTGVGIAKEELPRLFERFHRVEGARSRTHEGSGIGLALVQDLVALHKGTIDVESTLGGGTEFRVVIPLGWAHLPSERVVHDNAPLAVSASASSAVEEAMRWVPSTENDNGKVESSGTRQRILVVDDNDDMRAYFKRLLGRHWQVATVGDGTAALAMAQEDPPALIISDVMMPGLDGLSLIPALRRQPATAHVPVMLVSARAGTEASVDALKAGACDYLVKPFSPRELVARVAAQLDRNSPTQSQPVPVAVPTYRDPEHSFLKTHDLARTRLFSLLMQAPQSLCILRGRSLVFEMANESYRRLTGSRPLIGRSLMEVFPDLDPAATALLNRVLEGERIVMDQLGFTMDWEWTGTPYERFFNFIYEPILDDDSDGVIGVFVAANDVTELVRVKREAEIQGAREREQAAEVMKANGALQTALVKLEASNLDLARSNEDLTSFASIVSHDLQEPLRMIISYLEILAQQYEPLFDTRAKTFFNYAIDGAHRMKRMITALLSYAQVGEAEIRPTPVAVGDVVADALGNLATQVSERMVNVDVQAMPTVQADAALLTQVFQNLIANGIKYTLEHTPEIKIFARESGDYWAFTVSDQGMGIEPDDQERIFQLFRRAASATQLPGLGIGLATCKKIVELHGGTISVESVHGDGSRFTFTLPRVPANSGLA